MSRPGAIEELMQALRCLPGVGPKTAQRMTYHLLQRDRGGGKRLASALSQAAERVGGPRPDRVGKRPKKL